MATVATVVLLFEAAPARAQDVDFCGGKGCSGDSYGSVTPIFPPDFNTFAQFENFGESFTYTPATDLHSASGGGIVAISSPFSLDVGGSRTSSLFAKEDGIVSFGQSLASGSFTRVADLRSLGVPLIAPFYADLNP